MVINGSAGKLIGGIALDKFTICRSFEKKIFRLVYWAAETCRKPNLRLAFLKVNCHAGTYAPQRWRFVLKMEKGDPQGGNRY